MGITVTVKRRKKLNPDSIIDAVKNERSQWVGRVIGFYLLGVADWVTPPEFTPRSKLGNNHDAINVYARGEASAIYRQIDNGFQREVAVSENWQSKTQPGVLHSRPGQGHLLKHNGQPVFLASPIPVVPRLFTTMIANEVRAGFFAGMRSAFSRAAKG